MESGFEMVDERTLLLQLQQRQQNSINQAIEIYTPYINTVIYNLAGNYLSKEDMEEICADVFIMLWKNAEYINLEKGTLKSYMAVSTRNFALKRLRKKNDFTSLDEIEVPDSCDFEKDCVNSDAVWKAVMSLGEPDNEIFVRCYKYQEKLRDIAKATGLKVSTVKSKLLRGKRKLKKILMNAEESL